MPGYDVVIIGSGAGGGTAARYLAEHGKRVLVLERGDYLPREPQNWDTAQVFEHNRYGVTEQWEDRHGRLFTPGEHYNVGGKTKLYGAALFRLPERTLDRWPVSASVMDAWYDLAERWYHVHTEPHAPVVQRISDVLSDAGYHPTPAPVGTIRKDCIGCHLCDGFPCPLHAKADAETCGIRPAIATGNVAVWTNCQVTGMIRHSGRGEITQLYLVHEGQSRVLDTTGIPVILAAGAVNSALLWQQSQVPDSSGMAGRNYMMHLSRAVLAMGREEIPPGFHKTLFCEVDGFGTIQMAGQPQPSMLRGESVFAEIAPGVSLREIAKRSVTFWLMTEDHPMLGNTVSYSKDGRPKIDYMPAVGDRTTSHDLFKLFRAHLPAMGFHVHMPKTMGVSAVAHGCGTLRMSRAPSHGAVRAEDGRAWSTGNLYVADASVFPTSGDVNPALTIMANALRVAAKLV